MLAVIFIVVIIFRREGLLGQREVPLDRLFDRGCGDAAAAVGAGAADGRADQSP